MRALGRDGWLLCRWPLEESIHAESDADDSSSLGAFDSARQFPADSRRQRTDEGRDEGKKVCGSLWYSTASHRVPALFRPRRSRQVAPKYHGIS